MVPVRRRLLGRGKEEEEEREEGPREDEPGRKNQEIKKKLPISPKKLSLRRFPPKFGFSLRRRQQRRRRAFLTPPPSF